MDKKPKIRKNIIILMIESLRYDRLFGRHIPTKYRMDELLELANDATTFHKCINVGNATWTSTVATIMGTDMSYHHNKIYHWQNPLNETTATNNYSDSLYYILNNYGYKTGAFFSPNKEYSRTVYYDMIDGNTNDRIGPIWGCPIKQINISKTKKDNFNSLINFIELNKKDNFAAFFQAYDDHFSLASPGIVGRLECFKETSYLLGKVIDRLKILRLYDNTDIYILGDHGDSYFAFSEVSGDDKLQHACTPFHTSTHVPFIAKSDYLIKEERYDLVSQIDIYSTVLNSLNINFKKNNLLKNHFSIDLNNKTRDYVVSQNRFASQGLTSGEGTVDIIEGGRFPGGARVSMGIAITKGHYVYVKNEDGVYLFNHIIDPLNVSNLLRGFKEINFPHQHVYNWFDKSMMQTIKNKVIPDFEKMFEDLSKKGYINNRLNHVKPNI